MAHSDPLVAKEYQLAYYQKNRKAKLAAVRSRRENNLEAFRAKERAYHSENRESRNRSRMERYSKMSPEAKRLYNKDRYEKDKEKFYLLAGRPRPELCELCGEGGIICFDHCHASGRFRGWICRRCNSTLGFVKDSPEILRKMANYLEENKFGEK